MIGHTVSHYEILEKLGEGGMGIVYRARDLKLDRPVALKFLPPDLTSDAEARQRFVQEAKAASALDHPNICTVHDIVETEDNRFFIVMALHEGGTLREKISRGPLSIDEATDIGAQIAQGLARAHEKGIVHRDIKPANISVSADGIVRILDFGLAKLSGQTRITREGSTLGTAAYMSPEQVRGDEVDLRTDIWSLGVVLYEMLTGKLPFKPEYPTALVYTVLNAKPEPPSAIRPEIPRGLERVILKALEKEPGDRFASGADLVAALRSLRLSEPSAIRPAVQGRSPKQWIRRPIVVSALVAVVLGGAGAVTWMLDRAAGVSRARDEFLPRIHQALLKSPYNIPLEEFTTAQEAREYIGDDPEFRELWTRVVTRMSVTTDPPGADVMVRNIGGSDEEWRRLGVTPLEDLELPRSLLQWRLQKDGYIQVDDLVWTMLHEIDRFMPASYDITMDPVGSVPNGMIRVQGDSSLGRFFMDKYEVTNRQYREFVRAGGYVNRALWKAKFVEDGREIPWEEAVKRFVDATGRPGPATWRAGDCREGEEEYPVSGISWYEAEAFAEFAGKRLPSVQHWSAAARLSSLERYVVHEYLIPASNFSGKGARPVGAGKISGPFGLMDLAGNVREWCWNESVRGRCLRGGAWDDATYMYRNITQAPPFDRSPKNGFRCISSPAGTAPPSAAFQPITPDEPYDVRKVKQISDVVYAVYRGQYTYDRAPLQATTEFQRESPNGWVTEKVSFNNFRPGESLSAYLFLPGNAVPPFQTVVYFPGAWAARISSSHDIEEQPFFLRTIQYVIKSGRAVVHPITVGMYERGLPDSVWDAMGPYQYADYIVRLVREYRRTVDYLESRTDIDTSRLAYYGMSWGGRMGNVILAVEDRFKASILEVGGVRLDPDVRPEVRLLYYTPRITLPVLMLNGEYDMTFPLELNVKPMFEMIRTPPAHKRLKLYPTDHFIPPDDLLKESLAWLDKYLGPVRFR